MGLTSAAQRATMSLVGSHNAADGFIAGNLVQAGMIGAVRLPAPAPQALAGLPADEGFVGRAEHLAALDEVLAPDAAHAPRVLVSTVAGLAGVGKTALAVRAGRRAADEQQWFPGGVLFVDLHGYDPDRRINAHTALGTLLRALGIAGDHIPPDQQGRELLYRSVLAEFARQELRVLVIADNAATVDQVLPLRPGDRAHRLLVTSRHTLPIPGARRIEVDVLPEAEAIDIVHQALRTINPADQRIAEDPAAAALVRLCGYLPLALRIIAELLADQPERTVTDLVRDLSIVHRRLTELAYSDSLAVRAAFDQSYRHLPAEQARLFRLLSLNLGPHTDVGAAAVLAHESIATTRHLLNGLRRSHLIRPATTPDSFRFHDLLHIYARERCEQDEQPADRETATDRMLDYYRATARAANDHLDPRVPVNERSTQFSAYGPALSWLDAEWPNLVAAIVLAYGTGRYAHARDIPPALFFFVDLRGQWTDWAIVNQHASTACQAMGDRRGEAFALNNLGDAYRELQKFDDAIHSHQQALAICREIGARHDEGVILGNLGNTYHKLRRFDTALRYHRQALTICRQTRNRFGEGTALNNIGNAHRELGNFDDAIHSYQQDLLICREIGARRGEGIVMGNLGNTYYQMRQFEVALSHYQQKLSICRETDDLQGEATALNNLGSAYRELGQMEVAAHHYEQALARHSETGRAGSEAEILINLATICHELGHYDKARHYAALARAAFSTR